MSQSTSKRPKTCVLISKKRNNDCHQSSDTWLSKIICGIRRKISIIQTDWAKKYTLIKTNYYMLLLRKCVGSTSPKMEMPLTCEVENGARYQALTKEWSESDIRVEGLRKVFFHVFAILNPLWMWEEIEERVCLHRFRDGARCARFLVFLLFRNLSLCNVLIIILPVDFHSFHSDNLRSIEIERVLVGRSELQLELFRQNCVAEWTK